MRVDPESDTNRRVIAPILHPYGPPVRKGGAMRDCGFFSKAGHFFCFSFFLLMTPVRFTFRGISNYSYCPLLPRTQIIYYYPAAGRRPARTDPPRIFKKFHCGIYFGPQLPHPRLCVAAGWSCPCCTVLVTERLPGPPWHCRAARAVASLRCQAAAACSAAPSQALAGRLARARRPPGPNRSTTARLAP